MRCFCLLVTQSRAQQTVGVEGRNANGMCVSQERQDLLRGWNLRSGEWREVRLQGSSEAAWEEPHVACEANWTVSSGRWEITEGLYPRKCNVCFSC